jgi:hypothetical protein
MIDCLGEVSSKLAWSTTHHVRNFTVEVARLKENMPSDRMFAHRKMYPFAIPISPLEVFK